MIMSFCSLGRPRVAQIAIFTADLVVSSKFFDSVYSDCCLHTTLYCWHDTVNEVPLLQQYKAKSRADLIDPT